MENKIKGNPIPNIKIITHYKQITILNVIFVIMLMARPGLGSPDFGSFNSFNKRNKMKNIIRHEENLRN